MDHADSDTLNISHLVSTTPVDDNVELLKSMGFPNENSIRQALEIAKNDLNEALTILTNERSDDPKLSDTEMDLDDQFFDNSTFPLDSLATLESNLFSESRLVSYKKNEWLDRLLKSSIHLTQTNRFGDANEASGYSRFVSKLLPEYFKKLLDSISVCRLNDTVQSGVHSIVLLCIDLILAKLKSSNRDHALIFIDLLAFIFNPKIEFNKKNSFRSVTVKASDYQNGQQTSGWLLDYINKFADSNGFDCLLALIETSDLNESNSILKPLSVCIDYLDRTQVKLVLEKSFKLLTHSLSNIESLDQFRNKNCGQIFELMETLKKLSSKLWPEEVSNFNELHLKIALLMLKNSNFNSKMNSLKEICKLIDNLKFFTNNSTLIDEDLLATWLINEKIFLFAIEGNLDQVQYCDKLKTIVEFLGNRIGHEEIKTLWEMQFNKPASVVDNLYSLISIVTSKFNCDQLNDLMGFIKSTWNDPNFSSHDKLVYLLRLIGQELKNSKTHLTLLDALWSLRNENTSADQTLNKLIYKEHLNVLNTDRVYRDQAKSIYAKKCIDLLDQDHKLNSLYALKHLFDILNSYKSKLWPSSKSLKDVLSEIVVPEIKKLCQNLIDYIKFSDQYANNTFTYEHIIDLHLNLLKFVLKEGNLYLRLIRAQEIWDSLISSNNELNRDKCLDWFIECILDLSEQTRNEIFKERIEKLDPSSLTQKGYQCYRLYFLHFNQSESKIQLTSSDTKNFLVEESDLDLDYLWQLILNNKSSQIVYESIEFLIKVSYSHLASSLRRDMFSLNSNLIHSIFEKMRQNECNETKLDNLLKCLEEFIRIVDENETSGLVNHSNSIKIDKIKIKIAFNDNRECLELSNFYSNDILENLRQKIGEVLNNSVNNFQLYHKCKLLTQSLDSKTLCSLDLDESSVIACKIVPSTPVKSSECFTTLSNSSIPSSSLFSNRLTISSPNEMKKYHPDVIISSNQESYEIFDRLLSHKNSLIAKRARGILNLLPTNTRLIDMFNSIILFDSTPSSLEQYFTLDSNNLNKIIYNLEVLSIQILKDENFKQKFLKKNGLNMLIDIFAAITDLNDTLSEHLLILLINLVDCVLLDQNEPMFKKSLVCTNSKLIDLLLKNFIKKSENLAYNIKISIKSINLVFNLISSNLDQVDCLIESALFRKNIINVLICSKCEQIRQNLVKFFIQLGNLNESIKYRLIVLILKNTRVPIWTNSTKHMRSSARDLINQSNEYFSLLSNLIENMSQKLLSMDKTKELDVEKLLINQRNWFQMFNLSSNLDQVLLKGHFKLTKAILTNCLTTIKELYAPQLTDLLVKSFLFRPYFSSSDLILEEETLSVGYELLLELIKESKNNFSRIKSYLCQINQESKLTEWNYTPLIKLKLPTQKYIGLRNGGSTCYMNAVLQQLFMIPGICDYIQLMSTISKDTKLDNQLLFELDNIFMHLKKSNQEFYSPENFWKNFRMWRSGDSINIREQQDAFDFFISLTDQIDEFIQKELKKEPVFKSIFEGTYSNQFICQDCDHSYDRQESFLALNLSVKTFSNLEQSMAQFVKDELLTGDNSYFCEKCNHKRSAIKRTCLKKLPNYLCIQLKRFDYDWESNQALKFNDNFGFPIDLNVNPFTYDHLNKVNSSNDSNYELCGILVHSGQANAGHYYSFIKELDNFENSIEEEPSGSSVAKWFKFNDTHIDEIVLEEKFLTEECFGGKFTKPDSYLPDERTRYWNAYMLFYKHKSFKPFNFLKTSDLNVSKKIQFRDSISELSDLVEQCDNQAKNSELDNLIRAENLNLLKHNLTINEKYFDFVFNLINQNVTQFTSDSLDLSFNFLFFIYFKLNSKLRCNYDLNKWFKLFVECANRQIYAHILEYFNQTNNLEILKNFIFENSAENEVNDFVTNLIITSMSQLEVESKQSILNSLIKNLCSMVVNSLLNASLNNILRIIYSYLCTKEQNAEYLLRENEKFAQKLIVLISQSGLTELKEFAYLYEIVSLIALNNLDYRSLIFESDQMLKQIIGVFDYINISQLKYTLQLINKFCLSEQSSIVFIKQILSYLNQSSLIQADSKQIVQVLQDIILMESDSSLNRLKLCMEGESESIGLLTIIRDNLNKDPKKSYNCVKLIVNLANNKNHYKEYLLKISSDWEWSVSWLKNKMNESNFDSRTFSSSSTNFQSSLKINESKTFHRTKSAQATLENAIDLLSSDNFL